MIKLWSFAPKARENFCLPLWSNYDHPPLWSFILSEFTWNKMIKLWSNILLFRSDVYNNLTEKVENSRRNAAHCYTGLYWANNSNTNTFGHEYRIICNMQVVTCNMQVGFFDKISIKFNFCLKKSFVSPESPKWSNYDHPNFWKTLPTIMIKLWSPTIMIIWSRQRLGWTKSGIMIDHFSQ